MKSNEYETLFAKLHVYKNETPKRTHPRLKQYNYSSNGAYFITVCVNGKREMLGKITVGRDDLGTPNFELSEYGVIARKYIDSIESHYKDVSIDKYVVMPNHIHLIIIINKDVLFSPADSAPESSRPTALIPAIISALKKLTNREFGFNMWQSSYYDRIIRNEEEYLKIWQYIDNNPARWAEDEYYSQGQD
ncbi:MAG: transposase [Eubacteriaceae bacterium]|nr:transposase [Eubacteriaceae bacterium]